MNTELCQCKPEDQGIEEYERGTYGCENCGKIVEQTDEYLDIEYERYIDLQTRQED